jgi:hypothetical protein
VRSGRSTTAYLCRADSAGWCGLVINADFLWGDSIGCFGITGQAQMAFARTRSSAQT